MLYSLKSVIGASHARANLCRNRCSVVLSVIFWEHLTFFSAARKWLSAGSLSLNWHSFSHISLCAKPNKRAMTGEATSIFAAINKLQDRLAHNTVVLRQDEFYSDFREGINRAAFSVDITHLDTRAPDDAALAGSAMRAIMKVSFALSGSAPMSASGGWSALRPPSAIGLNG